MGRFHGAPLRRGDLRDRDRSCRAVRALAPPSRAVGRRHGKSGTVRHAGQSGNPAVGPSAVARAAAGVPGQWYMYNSHASPTRAAHHASRSRTFRGRKRFLGGEPASLPPTSPCNRPISDPLEPWPTPCRPCRAFPWRCHVGRASPRTRHRGSACRRPGTQTRPCRRVDPPRR